MNTQNSIKSIEKLIIILFVLLTSMVLSSCASPQTLIDKLLFRLDQQIEQMSVEFERKIETRMPEDMSFENTKVSCVLAEIAQVSELKIILQEGNGDQRVSPNLGGKTVEEAVNAVVGAMYFNGTVRVSAQDGRSNFIVQLYQTP